MVYVDRIVEYPEFMIKARARRHCRRWSHLFGPDLEELHLFARGIGIKREYFQNKIQFPHYDLTPYKRNLAILRGAEQIRLIDYLRGRRGLGSRN